MSNILWDDFIANLENVEPNVLGIMYTLALANNWPKSVRDTIWETGSTKDREVFIRYYNRYKNKINGNIDD